MPQAPNDQSTESSTFTRRGFLKGVGVAAAAAEGLLATRPSVAQPAASPADPSAPVSGEVKIILKINGQDRPVTVEPRTTLLSALRDRLDPAITGPKLVCNAGTCGACTVMLDGKTAYGCNVLAIDVVGRQITTVEGLGTPDKLSPVQAAMCEKDGMMCGFCTSGFVTSITALLQANANPTLEDLKIGLKGNFCRCGTYPHVFEAALAAAKAQR